MTATGNSIWKISATRRIRCSPIARRSTPRSSNRTRSIPTARARSPSARCARTARPIVSGNHRSASGPIPTATPISATITTTPNWSRRCKDPVFRDYIAAMEKKKGKDETRRVLEVRRWNSNVYPNLSFMSQFQQLRVVHPIAVNRTVVYTYNFRLKGAPEQMFRNTISFANIVNGTGSLVLTDDLEIYNRIGMGLSSEGAEWIEIGRGFAKRRARCSWRPARPKFDQRNLYPQHARCLARLHDERAAPKCARHPDGGRWQRKREKPRPSRPRRRTRRPIVPRSTARRPAQADARPASLRAVSAARSAAARRRQIRRLARVVHARRLVLGAERARPGRSGRDRVADLRRPAPA